MPTPLGANEPPNFTLSIKLPLVNGKGKEIAAEESIQLLGALMVNNSTDIMDLLKILPGTNKEMSTASALRVTIIGMNSMMLTMSRGGTDYCRMIRNLPPQKKSSETP